MVFFCFGYEPTDIVNTCKRICTGLRDGRWSLSLFTCDGSEMCTAQPSLQVLQLVCFMPERPSGPKATAVLPSIQKQRKIKTGIIHHFLMLSPHESTRPRWAVCHPTEHAGVALRMQRATGSNLSIVIGLPPPPRYLEADVGAVTQAEETRMHSGRLRNLFIGIKIVCLAWLGYVILTKASS